MTRIPKVLHYCFGYDPTFGGKPWSLVHYVCVKSAIERLNPAEVCLYYEYEPQGAWWEQTKRLLTPVKITAPREIFGNPLEHVAHRADLVRVETLIKRGGIYLDADVLVHRSFDHLLKNSVVLGEEGVGGYYGLANAVILAEPEAPFLRRWHDEFRFFRSKGRDQYWSELAVQVPFRLSKAYPEEVTVLPHTAFFWPLWTRDHLEMIYGANPSSRCEGMLANHLWESHAWDDHLEFLTPGKVRNVHSNFHVWARPFVADLPDNYGAPTLKQVLQRTQRIQGKRLISLKKEIRNKLNRARELGLVGVAARVSSKCVDYFSRRRSR